MKVDMLKESKVKKKRGSLPNLTDTRDFMRLLTVLLFLPWMEPLVGAVFGIEVEFELEAAVLVMFLFFGSFWCGWLCPFGNADYFIGKIGQKLFPSLRFKLPGTLDTPMRYLKYGFLGAFIYIIVAGKLDYLWDDHMTMYKSTVFSSGYIYVKKYLILLLPLLTPRFFCKYVCFQKALYNIMNKLFPAASIRRDPAKCISCAKCDRACPMEIKISEMKRIAGSDCIGCFSCVEKGTCPEKANAIHLVVFGKKVNPVVFSLFALLFYYAFTLLLHAVY